MDFDRLRRRRGSATPAGIDIPGCTDAVEVGRGGFGVVYRAQQPAYRRTVAVKVLRASLDGKTKERFERECMALGSLSGHPNIVTLFDAGLTGAGDPYLVMEYLGGGSLEDRVNPASPLGWQEAVDAGIRLAGALHTAHQAGVLHRDIKPRNVLMSNFGELSLVDFGLARLKGSLETRQADIAASVAYAPPEVLNGRSPSVASDVYSLGATIFSLLWGRPPFVTDDEQLDIQVMSRIASSPLPDARPRGVPDAVCRVLERAMAKEPGERFASAAEFGTRLQAAQAEAGLPVTPLRLEQDVQPRPTAAPQPSGSFYDGREAGTASPAPPPAADSGQTVRRAQVPVPDGAAPPRPPPPATSSYLPPAPPSARGPRRDRTGGPLARIGLPETIAGQPAALVIGAGVGLLVLLLVAVWGITRIGGGQEADDASPPREGRYRYRTAVTGDQPPVPFPETVAEVQTTSRSGANVGQVTITTAGDGSSDRTARLWTPEGLFEDELVHTKSGVLDICDWQPDIPLLKFPLAPGAQPVVEVSCRKPFGVELIRRISSRVAGSGRAKVGGKEAQVWNIERTETQRFLTGGNPVTIQEVTTTEKFAPKYGLVVYTKVDISSTTAGKTTQSSLEVTLLNLDPV